MVGAPFDHLLQDGLVDLYACVRHGSQDKPGPMVVKLTLGIGMASPVSPKSSSMFLIRRERSATSRSA